VGIAEKGHHNLALLRQTLQLDGLTTAYLEAGQGETLVALHGIPTSSLLFAPLFPYLPNYHWLAPDLLGQGQTAVPPTGRLDYAAYAKHLQQFMARVPPPQFHFLLHDLGGLLGLDWASAHPEQIKSLILCSTTITGSWWVSRGLYAANWVLGRGLLEWGLSFTLKRAQHLEAALKAEWAKPWTRRRLLRGADHFAGSHLQRIRANLHRLQMPVLIVWGEQDNVFPLPHATRLQQAFPQASLHTLQHCGHWSPLDAPQEIAHSIQKFLSAF